MEDRAQLDDFCQREFPRLVGTLTLYCGDRDLGEELAQDALVKAIKRWPQVSSMSYPGAWVHRVAINLANSHFRRRRAALRALRRASAGRDDEAVTPRDRARDLDLREAVSRLPSRQRAALVLRYYADLPVAQVAEIMGLESSSVKSHVSRALAKLRDDMGVTLPVQPEGASDG